MLARSLQAFPQLYKPVHRGYIHLLAEFEGEFNRGDTLVLFCVGVVLVSNARMSSMGQDLVESLD